MTDTIKIASAKTVDQQKIISVKTPHVGGLSKVWHVSVQLHSQSAG